MYLVQFGLYQLTLIAVLSITLVNTYPRKYQVLTSASELIFGKLWEFGNYCGDDGNTTLILMDGVIQSNYLNGTIINALENKAEIQVPQDISRLYYDAIVTKNSFGVSCSAHSWGYQDETSFKLSNSPNDNESECHKNIDESLLILESLVEQPHRSPQFSDHVTDSTSILKTTSIKIYNDTRSILKGWNQLNSFGRIDSNALRNGHIWTGDYPGCLKLTDMRFCYGALTMYDWHTSDYVHTNSFRVGLCLPKSCNSRSAVAKNYIAKLDRMIKLNGVFHLGESLSGGAFNLTDLFCLPTDDSPTRSIFAESGSVMLTILVVVWFVIVMLTSLGTLESLQMDDSSILQILQYFDVRRNWNKFLRNDHIIPEFAGLNFCKVIAMVWLILCHASVLFQSYVENFMDYRDIWGQSITGVFFTQGQHAVPAFFIISGILIASKELNASKTNAKKIIVSRYLRLVPMYLIVYVYIKKFSHLLSSGPLWDYGISTQSETSQCRKESWLVPILLLANFIPPFSHCIITGWHIANDFQIYLILPVLFIIYRRSRLVARCIMFGCFIASHLYHIWSFATAANYSHWNLLFEGMVYGPRFISGRMGYEYANPFMRLGNYILGVIMFDLLQSTLFKNTPNKYCNENNEDSTTMMELAPSNCQVKNTTQVSIDSRNDDINGDSRKIFIENLIYRLSFFIGVCQISFALFSALGPPALKFMFRPFDVAITYPSCRFSAESGWFLIIFALLLNNRRSRCRNTIKGHNNVCKKSLETSHQPAVIYTMVDILYGLIMKIIRSNHWNVLVRLNYCLILIHYTVARYLIQSQSQLLVFNWSNFFQISFTVITFSYLVGFVLHLGVEMPVTLLINRLNRKLWHKSSTNSRQRQ